MTFLNYKGPLPQDYGYAVFGKVTKGMDIVEKIGLVKTVASSGQMRDVPAEPVMIESIRKSRRQEIGTSMLGFEDQIAEWFLHIAYQPVTGLLPLVVGLMFASSFGLPLPEEVTIISASLTAFMATHPGKLPTTLSLDAVGVNPYTLSRYHVCLLAVFASDYVIYWIGSYFGDKLLRHPRWQKRFEGNSFKRVQKWIHEYGTSSTLASFASHQAYVFQGHMMCGAIGLPRWKFILSRGS